MTGAGPAGSTASVRVVRGAEAEQAWALGVLAFGGDPAAPARPEPAGARTYGAFDGDRLVATAGVRAYTQWWGGRRVPVGGLAGVAVHPDARGRGTAAALVRDVLARLGAAGQVLSVLFPTAPGIYRGLGWEVVGTRDQTLLPTAALRQVRSPAGTAVRTASHGDAGRVQALWRAVGAAGNGQLTRDGPSFPRGADEVLSRDVLVLLAERDGEPLGYLGYSRGRGYGPDSVLTARELVSTEPAATAALLASLGSWDAVAPRVRWHGPVDELDLLLPQPVPPPDVRQPWMLRVVDAPGAIAARGFPVGCRQRLDFTLVDPERPEHAGPWRLTVEDGQGTLGRVAPGPPRLHVRGLSLLYAAAAGPALLRRTGLLDGEIPGLEVFAGPRPVLLDTF